MQVKVPPELAEYVRAEVASGRFPSASDLIAAAVASMRDATELSRAEISELRREVDVGLAQAKRGEFAEFTAEDVITERRAARSAARGRRRKGA